MTFVDMCCYFSFISHIHCLVAVCQPLIKLLLTYLLFWYKPIQQGYSKCDQQSTIPTAKVFLVDRGRSLDMLEIFDHVRKVDAN